MSDVPLAKDMYERLMAVNQQAFEAGLFNVAYHALAAALYCARQLPDNQGLHAVERVAREQLAWIDQNAPGYEHSSESAAQRNHESIFLALARQAAASVQINHRREHPD